MISVLILTAGRANLLQQCLDALKNGTRVPDETVVLVTREDATSEEVLKQHPLRNLRWETLVCSGGSYAEARNALVRMARTNKIAFLDDDCIPAPDWLARCEVSLDRFDAVGGIVAPGVSLRYPAWWHPQMAWMAGLSVPGALNDRSGASYYPASANLAVRRSVLLAEPFQELGGGFSSSSQDYATGREDAELWRRLRVKGYGTACDPEQCVYHQIPQERLQYPALLSRARHDGAALIRREANEVALHQAWKDVAYWPLTWLRRFFANPFPHDPQRALDRLWHARQKAVIHSWRQLPGEQARLAEESAKKAAIQHVLASEAKRPVGRILSLFHRMTRPGRYFPSPPRRVLVVSAGFLGDAILTASLVHSWRQRWPGMAIDAAVTSGWGISLLRDQNIFVRIYPISCKKKEGTVSLKHVIDRGAYDVIIAPHFHTSIYPRTGHLFRPFGPPVIMFAQDNGLQRASDQSRASLRLHRNMTRNELLSLKDLFSLAAEVGELRPWRPQLTPAESHKAIDAIRELHSENKALIVLYPGAGNESKEWVWDRWFELAGLLEQQGNLCLFVCDRRLLPRIQNSLSSFNLHTPILAPESAAAEDQFVRTIASILPHANLMICPDTGPRHLAAAMGTPTVCIFGNMDERRWSPYFDRHKHANVRAVTWDLMPEELAGRPVNYACSLITVEQVFKAAESLLQFVARNNAALNQ